MKNNLISLDVKNSHIQIRISQSDKAKIAEYAANHGGISHWLVNLALNEISKNKTS